MRGGCTRASTADVPRTPRSAISISDPSVHQDYALCVIASYCIRTAVLTSLLMTRAPLHVYTPRGLPHSNWMPRASVRAYTDIVSRSYHPAGRRILSLISSRSSIAISIKLDGDPSSHHPLHSFLLPSSEVTPVTLTDETETVCAGMTLRLTDFSSSLWSFSIFGSISLHPPSMNCVRGLAGVSNVSSGRAAV